MDAIIAFGIIAVLAIAALGKPASQLRGMSDKPVLLENIRQGVKNGWYKATLTYYDGKPAVHLYGKDTNGNAYGDIFPISRSDWETLRKEGYEVEL